MNTISHNRNNYGKREQTMQQRCAGREHGFKELANSVTTVYIVRLRFVTFLVRFV